MAARRGFPRWLIAALGLALLAIVAAAFVWRDDILRTDLDPKVPFQTYDPPPAPDYADKATWALIPAEPASASAAKADVFFISPTTYDGGRHWNGPTTSNKAERTFRRVMAPNYAGPFVRVGRIFAPRYRQASLYSLLTLREDAREARRFAYDDVARAYRTYRDRYGGGRPLVVVGVEQGGTLASRLLREEIAPDPKMRGRLVAAYLIEAVSVGDEGLPACARPEQSGCVAAWVSAREFDIEAGQKLIDRSLVWDASGVLENLEGRRPLCFNPLLHAVSNAPAPARLNRGAANATGLEWGARPPFLKRQVSAQCKDGILRRSRPKSPSLRRTGAWAERKKVPGYNLFYADIEADADARLKALMAKGGG